LEMLHSNGLACRLCVLRETSNAVCGKENVLLLQRRGGRSGRLRLWLLSPWLWNLRVDVVMSNSDLVVTCVGSEWLAIEDTNNERSEGRYQYQDSISELW